MPLFDSDAELHIAFNETNVTSSVSSSNKSAILIGGVTPTNTGSFLRMSEAGSVIMTGSVEVVASIPLTIGAFSANVTGSVKIVATEVTQSVTGSIFVFNNPSIPIWSTGSATINSIAAPATVIQGVSGAIPWKVTGTVDITSIASPVHQGNAGTQLQGWFVKVTDGTQVLGTGSSAPFHTTGSATINSIATPVTVIQGASGAINWKVTGSQFIFNNSSVPTWITGSATINSVASPVTVTQGLSGSLPWKTDQNEYATFIVGVTGAQIGNNKNMLSIMNAQGSNVVIRILKIQVMNVQLANITGITAIFNFLRIGDHSGGTIVNAVAHDSYYTTSSNVTTRTDSTITGSTTAFFRMLRATDERNTAGSLDPETFEYVFSQVFGDYSLPLKAKPITLHAGEGISIRQTENSTAGTFDIFFLFTQEGP